MKPYLAVLSARFQMLLQYRVSAIAGICTQIFFGIIRLMLFDALFQSSSAAQPMSHDDVVTYIWLGQGMLSLIMLDVDHDVMVMIRTGSVAYELVRPVNLYNLWFSRALSDRMAPLLMRSVPLFIVGSFFGLGAPASPANGVAFVLAAAGALFLAASIIVLLNISLFWTISGNGLSRICSPLILLFSGIVVPLPFLPEWAQPLAAALPLRGLTDTPFQIYLGRLSGMEAVGAMLHQWIWIALLVAAGRAILGAGIRRLVVQGG